MAITRLKEAGATIEKTNFRIEGFPVDAQVSGSNGRTFLVLARETPDEQDRGALRRTDTVEKAGFMAMQLARRQARPIILITSDLPKRSTRAGQYLAALSDDSLGRGVLSCRPQRIPTIARSLHSDHREGAAGRPVEGSRKDHFTKPVQPNQRRFRSHDSGVDRHGHGWAWAIANDLHASPPTLTEIRSRCAHRRFPHR